MKQTGLCLFTILLLFFAALPAAAQEVFQRFINYVLRSFIDEGIIVVYMDDVIIMTVTLEEHFDAIHRVLSGRY